MGIRDHYVHVASREEALLFLGYSIYRRLLFDVYVHAGALALAILHLLQEEGFLSLRWSTGMLAEFIELTSFSDIFFSILSGDPG